MVASQLRWRICVSLLIGALGGIAKEKKPELPPQVTELIDVLFRAPAFEQAELSPGGTHLALIREVNGLKVFDTLELATGLTRRLAGNSGVNQRQQSGLDQNISHFMWLGPNQLALLANEGNQYYSGWWITDSNLRDSKPLATNGRVFLISDALPQNPVSALAYEASADGMFGPLWRLDKKSLTFYEAERNPGKVIAWQTDVAGAVRLAVTVEPGSRWSYSYRETEKSAWAKLPLPSASQVVTFDVSGKNLLISTLGKAGRRQLQTFDLEKRELDAGLISNPVYDVSPDVVTDSKTSVPVGLRYETEKPVIVWLNSQYAQAAKIFETSFPGHVVASIGTTSDDQILFSVYADTDPVTFYRYNSRKQEIKPVLSSRPTAAGAKNKWAPMQPVTFAARDRVELHGYLTLPVQHQPGQKLPLVALSHGGPQTRDSWGFDPEVQFLAALGYGVLQVNYRGSTGYGAAHELNNTIETAERSVDDVVDGIRWTIERGVADPRKIVAYGGSYGGYISLGIATRYPELPAAVIGFAGVYDWVEDYKHGFDEWNNPGNFGELFKWRADYYLDPVKYAERYRALSPVNFAAAVRCPVLLHHGRIDQTVQIAQSNKMARALQQAGKIVEVTKDSEGIHGLASEKQSQIFYRNLATFLLKYVPPEKQR